MRLWPFSKKSDWDRNGNRFYMEYITERGIKASSLQLRVTSALAAGLRIAEGVAAMQIVTGSKKRDAQGRAIRTPVFEGPIFDRLCVQPNDYMTPVEFVESLTLHAVFEGVGRAYIDRGYKGKIRRLIPLLDGGVNVRKDPETGRAIYSATIPGVGQMDNLTRRDFIEVTNPRWQDIEGLDITSEIKKVLNLAWKLEDRQDDDANRKAVPGYISTNEQLSEGAAQGIRDALKDKLPNTPIFDSGAAYKSIVPTQAEMQLLETRRFLIEEVARAYGIHPIFLAHDAAGQSLTRIADAMDYHMTVTLGPWVRRWEQAIAFSLLDPGQFVNLDETQYYRGDLKTQAEYAAKALGNNAAWETPNDIRARMGQNPTEGGDTLPTNGAANDAA